MTTRISRRRLLQSALAGASLGALGAPALVRAATTRQLIIGGPIGQAAVTQRDIIPSFESKYQCKILFDGSQSFPNLQKLQANKDKPVYSVVMMDDPALYIAADQGLLEPLKQANIPSMAKLAPAAVVDNAYWVHYMWPALSIGYNENMLKSGVASWTDLWDPKYKGRVLIPNYRSATAAFVTAMAAHLETGKPIAQAQYDLDAGFKKLATLKSNLLETYHEVVQATVLVEQGEAYMAAGFYSTYVLPRHASGVPISLARPKEGSFAMPKGVAKVKNAPEPELADAFIEECLQPDFQTVWMRRFYAAPTNLGVTVDAGILPAQELLTLDWKFASAHLKDAAARFDREFAS